MNDLQNRKEKQDIQKLTEISEHLLVETEIITNTKNQMESAAYNINNLNQQLDEKLDKKKELLKLLRESRENGTSNRIEIESNINSLRNTKKFEYQKIEEVETQDLFLDWKDMVKQNREYAAVHNIDLNNQFIDMFSENEKIVVFEDMTSKFELLRLEKNDYVFAAAAGVVAGFIDVLFVGTIQKGKNAQGLQKKVDESFEKIVSWYSKQEQITELKRNERLATNPEDKAKINTLINNIKENKVMSRTGELRNRTIKDDIKFLEKTHRVSYDAVRHSSVSGMTPDNHHLLSLAHDPSILGLIFGIVDQLTGKATFIDNSGKIVRQVTGNLNNELSGNIIQKIIQAVSNWFGHLMSDVAGSSTSKGRGSGLPFPGASALQFLQFGNFNLSPSKQNMTIAEVAEWMFKEGYDLRAFTTELIPVVIYETLIRMYWFWKQYIYFGKNIKESLPIANSRELARLLLISSSSFSAVDVSHATIKSKPGSSTFLAEFIMTVNKPGLVDLGFRSYQNIRNEVLHRKKVKDVLENDIQNEYNRILSDV